MKWVYHCTAAWAEGRREAFREEVGERERERGRERERERQSEEGERQTPHNFYTSATSSSKKNTSLS